MSRYPLEPHNPRHEVHVGWDRPLSNFFLVVLDPHVDEDTGDPIVVWLGADGYATEPHVDHVLQEASKWAVVPRGLRALLLFDEQCEGMHSQSDGRLQ